MAYRRTPAACCNTDCFAAALPPDPRRNRLFLGGSSLPGESVPIVPARPRVRLLSGQAADDGGDARPLLAVNIQY